MNLQLARHCTLAQHNKQSVCLRLDQTAQQLCNDSAEGALEHALQKYYQSKLKLNIEVTETNEETPDQRTHRKQKERQAAAKDSILNDPFILELQEKLGAKILPNSIKLQSNSM